VRAGNREARESDFSYRVKRPVPRPTAEIAGDLDASASTKAQVAGATVSRRTHAVVA